MHLHLLIPDLLLPVDGDTPRLEALETLLAKGRRTATPPLQLERWLMQRFNAGPGQEADDPSDDAGNDTGDKQGGAAAYSLIGDGGDPSDGIWLRADPVHLRVDRDALVLADASLFGIDADEARALSATLNAHFGAALQIDARHPGRWYARLPAAPKIRCTPLGEARGEPVSGHLPSGADGMHWHALMNEVQMALHGHEVNEAREARGELPVNSLWFWGNGRFAPIGKRPFNAVLADDPLARGLAVASGGSGSPMPVDAASMLRATDTAGPAEGRTRVVLVVLDALRAPARYGDAQAWLRMARSIERDWIAPALAALSDRRIGMLTCHLPGDRNASGGQRVETVRGDLRRFWRRRKPLSTYVARPLTDAAQ